MARDAHRPVLLEEAVGVLQPAPGMRIVDATFGRGGHTVAFLSAGASVLALDRDPEAVAAAGKLAQEWGEQLEVRKMNFSDISSLHEEKIDAVFMDLGVSSPQLDQAERGFSFQQDGPLDMRMDPDQEGAVTAADIVNTWPQADLSRLLWEYGDERQARKIAAAICRERDKQPLERTLELAELVEKTIGVARRGKLHPATKTFQAIRIAVNGELEALDSALQALPDLLGEGGRFAIISFHALEDRRVKRFIQQRSEPELHDGAYAFGRPNPDYCLKKLGRWKPGEEEISSNPRARSARLRAAERTRNPSPLTHHP
jgi:16S rRNA (cytosine1402-N4)-methyltransferase